MSQQIFLDPDRKRWKRLRRIFDVAAVLSTLVLITFIVSVYKRQTLPSCFCLHSDGIIRRSKKTSPR